MNKKLRILGFILSLAFVIVTAIYGVRGIIKKGKLADVNDYQAYSEAVLEEAKSIPIQDDGRVKPFQTWAEINMLAMHGQRSMKILVNDKKVTISPTAWLLDVIFRPEQADKLPTFRVDNSEILAEFGLKVDDLRDRYSMNDLKPLLSEFDRAHFLIREKIKKSGKDSLTIKEKQTAELFNAINIYLHLRDPFILDLKKNSMLQQLGITKVSELFGYQEKILGFGKQSLDSPLRTIGGLNSLTAVFNGLSRKPNYFGEYSTLTFFPPAKKGEGIWYSAGKEYAKIASHNDKAYRDYLAKRNALLEQNSPLTEQKAAQILGEFITITTDYLKKQSKPYPDYIQDAVTQQESLSEAINSDKEAEQIKGIQAFKSQYENMIGLRGEGKQINAEISYNDRNYFNNGLVFIILALFLVIVRCILLNTKSGRVLYWLAYGVAALATLYIIAGITHRCIIMQRPPIGTLYDTMPFIVAASLAMLLAVELIGRKGIMLAVATVLGIGGIVLAKQYEVSQATDYLSPLRAVLKSNFWLTTHVITITLGYAGGLIAAAISIFFILGRAFGLIEGKPLRKHITGTVYGMVAFTLVFSLVGTILGGIWGAESWGRFWGWDPKENGALMIVIWVLIVLHARLGGYIKEIGFHCCGVFTAAVVVFSWWHVNFLGVGLHSYGFTSADAMGALWTFYGIMGFIILVGITLSIIEKVVKKSASKQAQCFPND